MIKNKSVTYTSKPYPIITVENFLTKEQCDDLISDAAKIMKNDLSVIHGGRKVLPSTDYKFQNLIKESKHWKLFHNMINDKEILNLLLKNIYSEKNDSYYKRWFKNKKLLISKRVSSIENFFSQTILNKWKRILDKKVKVIPKSKLFFILIIRFIDDFYRNLSAITEYFFGKCKLILFYDYSISNFGYKRSIHRDSDSRITVMLLYLNTLEKNVEGGSLEIYSSEEMQKYPPFLRNEKSLKVKEIKPVAGKLVMFLNTSNAYHAVSKMSHSDFGRHFIYGGFTMNSSFRSLALEFSNGKSPTEYHIYK